MKTIINFSEETKQAARKLFDGDMEMLHVYPPNEVACMHCGRLRKQARYDEECPALLRCALLSVTQKVKADDREAIAASVPNRLVDGDAKSRTGRMSDERCPKCGSTLLTNDYGQVWCSYIGGIGSRPCAYGIKHDSDCASRDYENMDYMPHTCDCGYEQAHSDKVAI